MLTLPQHHRYDYSVIGERKDYSWPGGKRLAFCVTHQYRGLRLSQGHRLGSGQEGRAAAAAQLLLARLRQPGRHLAAVRSVRTAQAAGGAQHQFAALRISPADLATASAQRGDEIVGHGRTNAERQGDLWELDEQRLIDDVTAGDRQARRPAAERLDGPGRRGEQRHARPAEGGRLQLRDGLAGRRPAVLAADARRSDPVGALPGRTQRFRRPSFIARTARANSPT